MLSLSPLKCTGKVSIKSISKVDCSLSYDAVFLCKSGKLEFIEENEVNSNSVIICDVVPLVLDYNPLLKDGTYSFRSLLSRDKGIFDNLPFQWYTGRTIKKQFYDRVQDLSRTKQQLPHDEAVDFQLALESCLKLKIVSLLLEETDIYESGGVSLGGAVVLANTAMEESSRWIQAPQASSPSPSAFSRVVVLTLPTAADEESRTACVANCHLDELLGLSQALQLPILCSSSLFRKLSMDAELRREENASRTSLCIYGEVGATTSPASSTMDGAVRAWEIFDANQFFTLSSREKRAILRASGVTDLPRPRLGSTALDETLLDLMDDAVRQEVRRKQKQFDYEQEDTAEGEQVPGSDDGSYSSRATLLQAMGKALEDGDMDSAVALRAEFARRTILRADPTQSKGSYDPYLDQDDWYLAARRKAMKSKPKNND